MPLRSRRGEPHVASGLLLVQSLLQPWPSDRPSASRALRHRFVKTGGQKPIAIPAPAVHDGSVLADVGNRSGDLRPRGPKTVVAQRPPHPSEASLVV